MMYTIILCSKRSYYTVQNNTIISYKHNQTQQVRVGFIRTFNIRESGYIETKSSNLVSYGFPIWRSNRKIYGAGDVIFVKDLPNVITGPEPNHFTNLVLYPDDIIRCFSI